jgi:hypothetical protein
MYFFLIKDFNIKIANAFIKLLIREKKKLANIKLKYIHI